MMDIKEDLILQFIIFFDKKSKGGGVIIQVKHNKLLAEELHKPTIRNFKKEQFIQDSKIIFGVLIQLICN